MTKEQLTWLQKLAVTTPYDNNDISNMYTLARSYDFADDKARQMTDDITNFASGMGLTSEEMQRVIINFGQLQAQGKLNGQELRDLARGSFVPINAILDKMKTKLGLTTEEFDKIAQERKSGPRNG